MNLIKWTTACLLVSSMLIVGCGGDDENDPTEAEGGHPPTEMVGTWIFVSVTDDGAAANLADVMEWQPGTVAAKFHIETIGTFVLEEVNAGGGQLWYETGFVFVTGNEMDINTLSDSDGPVNETSVVTFTLAMDVMTVTEVDTGHTYVFTLNLQP